MKKSLIFIAIVGTLLAVFLFYRRTHDYLPAGKTLAIGTTADFPPFSFRDNNNNIVGFDIDVAKEVAKRLDKIAEIKDLPFDDLFNQLKNGQVHVVAAGLTPNEERLKIAKFSKPYLTGNRLLIVSKKDKPLTSINDLKDKKVIVNKGYTADIYLSKFPEIKLIKFPEILVGLKALNDGDGDAFVTSSISMSKFIADNGENQYTLTPIDETDEEVALAISKTLPQELASRIEEILSSMESDGSMKALKDKWKVI